jgi:hypothetical protein
MSSVFMYSFLFTYEGIRLTCNKIYYTIGKKSSWQNFGPKNFEGNALLFSDVHD